MDFVDPLIQIITKTLWNYMKKDSSDDKLQENSNIAETYENVKYFEKQRGRNTQLARESCKYHNADDINKINFIIY